MLSAIYIGQSGMAAYSKGLDVISNNVANLNTAGFKVGTPLFSDELFQNDSGGVPGSAGNAAGGAGVSVNTERFSFAAGQPRNTGDPLTAALDGNGFFVLNRDGQRLYTRAGQFEYNADGLLVDVTTKAPVMVSNDSGSSTSFDVTDLRVYPPKATATVNLSGTLAATGTASTFSLPAVTLVDSVGGTQPITAKFVRNSADATQWSVEIDDASGKALGTGDLRFNSDGTPKEGHDSMKVTLTPGNGSPSDLIISFGAAGTFGGITSLAGQTTSQVQLLRQDGVQLGALQSTSFDDHGRLTLSYSNGLKKTPATLLLARIDQQEQLTPIGSGLFIMQGAQPQLAPAQTAGIGRVLGGQIEQSNVDLTQQFSDLIIIQRGYQASSQTTSVANEMIQTLLQMGQHP